MERQFMFKQFGNSRSLAGMTFKNAGNFYPDGSFSKAFEAADKALAISGFNQMGHIIMRAEGHGNNVWFFEKIEKGEAYQVFCDGVIYRGAGAAIFFPGGCPAIAFRDKKADISGMLHGGWKPITQGIVDNFLALWEDVGGCKQNTQIIFLPAVCKDGAVYRGDGYKYFSKTIYPAVKAMRPSDFFRFFTLIKGYKDEHVKFNLIHLICFLLVERGYEEVIAVDECVCCGNKFWFYDRDDKNSIKYRNAAFIISG